jgi:hypothetical protein
MDNKSQGIIIVLLLLIGVLMIASAFIRQSKIDNYSNYVIVVGNREYKVDDYSINGNILEIDDYYFGSTYYDESLVIQGDYSIIPH